MGIYRKVSSRVLLGQHQIKYNYNRVVAVLHRTTTGTWTCLALCGHDELHLLRHGIICSLGGGIGCCSSSSPFLAWLFLGQQIQQQQQQQEHGNHSVTLITVSIQGLGHHRNRNHQPASSSNQPRKSSKERSQLGGTVSNWTEQTSHAVHDGQTKSRY